MFTDQHQKGCCCPGCSPKVVLQWLAAVLVLVMIFAGLFLIRNWAKSYDYIGVGDVRDTINISGQGKVTAIPDIATFTIGLQIEKATVAAAQQENTTKMNAIIKALKELGVAAKDIQTSNYNIYPQYNWDEGQQTLRGYQVSQNVTVKVRDLEKVGEIFARAGELGANNVGGLQFTVDEPDKYQVEARAEALADAKDKAKAVAKAADMKLGKVVGFSESNSEPAYYRDYALSLGAGSAPEMKAAPSIEAGSSEVIVNVNVIYEVL